MRIKNGFTLAEVLVTMGILGVVAAMTIPTVSKGYQKKVYATSMHKTYSDVNQALQRVMSDRGAEDVIEAGLRSQASLVAFVDNYMKYNKKCAATDTDCFGPSSSYRKLSGSEVPEETAFPQQVSYILAGGASIRPVYNLAGRRVFDVIVDTNGEKGPNILGKDLFVMSVYRNGLIDDFNNAETNAPLTATTRESLFTNQCSADNTTIHGCFGKLINDNWQMKY